jgi:hypothetical protein
MDLLDFLRDVAEDVREDTEARKLALELATSWGAGLIPDPRRVEVLRRMIRKPSTCTRLKSDGQCDWLRKNARQVGLLPPLPGQVILCNRRGSGSGKSSFADCPGYRKGDYKGEDR